MRRIAILGGGISGLSAAYELDKARRAGADISYQLFEARERVGGVLKTEHAHGFTIELGAEAWLTEKSAAGELCRELGLHTDLLGSNDQQRKTYILVAKRLVALPEGLFFVVPGSKAAAEWELFSAETRAKIAAERQLAPRTSQNDESVADFAERHFGREAVEWLAEPMLAGVYGGDARKLSARAVMPRLVELERKHGSLLRGLESRSTTSSAPVFTTLKKGMQQLIEALTGFLQPSSIHLQERIEKIELQKQCWNLSTGETFDSLVLALPAYNSARLLKSVAPELSRELEQIEYSSSALVAFAYESDFELPPGFGLLVPPNESRRLMACTFVHQKFCGRSPEGDALLRVFFGGTRDPEVIELSDDELIALAKEELRDIIGIRTGPSLARVQRWPRSMPQYNVRHLERVARIESLASELPGLKLVGSAFHGVGIPDCIQSAREVAQDLIHSSANS